MKPYTIKRVIFNILFTHRHHTLHYIGNPVLCGNVLKAKRTVHTVRKCTPQNTKCKPHKHKCFLCTTYVLNLACKLGNNHIFEN